MDRRSSRTILALVVLAILPGSRTGAQPPRRDEVPLAEILEVLFLDRELIAMGARGGGQKTLRLELDEQLLWKRTRGKVGVALTNRRILAVATGSAAWQQMRYLRTEAPVRTAQLGDRVALVLTAVRAIGFNGETGNLVETRLGVRERVLARKAGENVAVVVTDRRALGLSPFVGGFFATPMRLNERLETLEADSNLVTVTTDQRVLIFRTPSGSWEERRRSLH